MVAMREWLLDRAKQEFLSFDKVDFDEESDEILEGYVESDDPATEGAYRNHCWQLMQTCQRDREYLASLNLHSIIARHVRNSCRKAHTSPSIESWVKLRLDSTRLDGSQLAKEIEDAIRSAGKVRAPWRAEAVPKFSEELSFESLDTFHLGLESIIGYPPTNEDFLDLMKREHEQGETFQDQEGRDVHPKVEWNIVLGSESRNITGAGCEPTFEIKKREFGKPLDFYIKKAKEMFSDARAFGAKDETLNAAEVAALRLWTGPMHKKYAEVLRNPTKPRCPYVNTLHALNSGITKLARIWRLPASRKVYRGYRNLSLKELKKDAFQCVGGVEKSVLATSEDFDIAVQYSGNGAFILEMDVGQVNRGADVSWVSQFPHEQEVLFNALSNIEFIRSPQLRFVEDRGTILVYQVCVSANVKSKTLEEFVSLRKDLHLNLVDVLTQEVRGMIYLREEGSRHGLIKRLCAECRIQCDRIVKEAGEADVGIFNQGAPDYVTLVEDAILLQSRALEIIDLALHWCETGEVDPSELDLLQDWQLEALRTAFRSGETPQVREVVLDKVETIKSFFTAELLFLDAVHKPETACRAAKLLTLNPNLNNLTMKVVSGTAEVWEQVFKQLCPGRPMLCVNGVHLAEFEAVKTLQQLELRNLDIQTAAMIAPSLQFQTLNALTSLSLWGSPIACTGAESLGRALSNLQKLRYVDLRSCKIADRGCTGISRGLPAVTELEELNLAHNNVKDDGFNILAAAIRSVGLSRLKSVDIRWNDTHLPSLRCGPQCILKNHSLHKIETNGIASCVAWSPVGDQIASGYYDGTIRILDAKTVEQVSTIKGHTSLVTSVAWSPCCNQIVSGGYGTGPHDAFYGAGGWSRSPSEIIIWDAKTGQLVLMLKGHTHLVTCVAWSPWGDQIASGSRDNSIIIWDARTGEQVSTLKGHTSDVTSVAWRPGGDQIASGSRDNNIIIWDAKTGVQVSALKGHTSAVMSVAWHPGGGQIVSGCGTPIFGGGENEIIIWDAKTGDQISTLKGHTRAVMSVTWRRGPRGDQIASASYDKTIIVWDATTGERISKLQCHTGEVMCVAWRPGGDQIASGSLDNTIIIWDAKTGKQNSTLNGHTGSVYSVAWRPGGDQFASASGDKTVIVWDATTGEQVSTLKGHDNQVKSVAWRPGGDQIASASSDQTIIIWDAKTGEQISTLKTRRHSRSVTCVTWRPIVSGGYAQGHTSTERVMSVDWHPEGDQIVSGAYLGDEREASDPGEMIIWDSKTRFQVSKLKGHTTVVMSIAWHPGGDHIASASYDNTIIIWDAKTGVPVWMLNGHTSSVESVAWRPGGDQIASASWDKTIIIWNARTGEQVSTLKGHTAMVTSVAWSPGGDQIVSGGHGAGGWGSPGEIIIWDTKTGEQVSTLKGHTAAVTSVAWRPGGDQIVSGGHGAEATYAPGEVIIWDTKTGEQVSMLKGHTAAVTSVAWRPGGDQFASGSLDNTIIIWDAKTGEHIWMLNGHTGSVYSMAWRPGGDQLASASGDKTVIVWDATTGEQVSTLKGHDNQVKSVAWRPGGDQIASASYDNTIVIWDAKTGEQISTLKRHSRSETCVTLRPIVSGGCAQVHTSTERVMSVDWHPGGDQIVSGGHGAGGWGSPGEVIIWDAKTGVQVSTLKGHTAMVTSVAWRPGGDQIVSGGHEAGGWGSPGEIIIWDAKTGEQVSMLKGHTAAVTCVAWSPGGDQIVSGGRGAGSSHVPGEVIIWDAKTGEQVSMLKGHTGAVTCVAWRPGGDQIASGSLDNTIIIWDAKTGEHIWMLNGHTGSVYSLAWSPGGDQFASGLSDSTIIIWDAKTGEQISKLEGHTDQVRSVAWRPERPGHPGGDQLASASGDKTVIVWDATTGEQVSTLKGHDNQVKSVAWRPGGDQIASASYDNTIIIWDAKTGEQISTLKRHSRSETCVTWRQIDYAQGHPSTERVMSLDWHPGGYQIVSGGHGAGGWGSPGEVTIWDAKTGVQVSKLKGHTAMVTSVAWRPGGDQIVSGGHGARTTYAPGEIIIWDTKTGEQVSTLKGHTAAVTSVAWRPGGDQIASASYDMTIIIWDAKTGEQVWTLKGHTAMVTSVAWRPGGDQLASASYDKAVIVWDAMTGEQVSMLKGHTDWVTSVAWRHGGHQIASGSDDKTIIRWDAKTGDQFSTLEAHKDSVMDVGLNPDETQIAAASDVEVNIIFDVRPEGQRSTLKGYTSDVMSLGCRLGQDQIPWSTSDDQVMSGSGNNTGLVCDSKAGKHRLKLEGDVGAVKGIGCSSDSQVESGSGSTRGNAVVWHSESEAAAGNLTLLAHLRGMPGVPAASGDEIVSTYSDVGCDSRDHHAGSEWQITTLHQEIEIVNSMATTQLRTEPNMYEKLETGAKASIADQGVAWQSNAAASENESVEAALRLSCDDECVDTDAGCQPSPPKKKKTHGRESQA